MDRAASEPVTVMDGDGQSDCDTAAVADAMKERVPVLELPGEKLPAGKDKVKRLEGDEDGIREDEAAAETILVAEEVALTGGVFEVEGEEEKVGVSMELLETLKDSNPLALALFPEAVG